MKYILILSLISCIACGQTPKKNLLIPPPFDYYLTTKETSRYAIFKFDAKRDHYIFSENSKSTTLSNSELATIERLIAKRVIEYNRKSKNQYGKIKKPEKYFKQLIAIINDQGEKEVWVNCCCQVMQDYWKTHIQTTMDGGSCYFTIKINLTKNIAYTLYANGLA